eukprot:g6996.t1
MHSGTRCVQCRKALTSSTAHSAQVMHRPVTVKGCLHGPFCPRCRRSVSRQVLPFCVCRALVENWLEMTVPTETLKPIVAQGPEKVAHTPARRPVETAARVTGATGKPGPGAPNPALASSNKRRFKAPRPASLKQRRGTQTSTHECGTKWRQRSHGVSSWSCGKTAKHKAEAVLGSRVCFSGQFRDGSCCKS